MVALPCTQMLISATFSLHTTVLPHKIRVLMHSALRCSILQSFIRCRAAYSAYGLNLTQPQAVIKWSAACTTGAWQACPYIAHLNDHDGHG